MSFTILSPTYPDPSPMTLPWFHATDMVPGLLLFYGLAVAFLGFRLSRFFCFSLGLVVGAYYVDSLFHSEPNVRHLALPLVVITLVSLVSAVTWLLMHVVTLSALLGYVLALLVLVMDSGRLFGWGVWRWVPIVALQAALLVAGRKNWTMLVVASTAVLGSLMTVLAIDHFADHTLSALLFTATYFRFLLGAQQAAPECGVDCWLLLLVWLVLSVVSFYVQLVLIQLQQTRLTKERQAVADDSVFATSAFSYDTFSSSTAVKPPTLPQSTPLTPLVSSASSSSFVLPPKATFNFFDPQRLPENLQPLYPVVQSAFDSVSAQYGFQAGNVANQGEHLLFLLGNVKSRGVSDAISRLHTKVFGNYTEWTQFLSLTAYCSSSAAYAGQGSEPSPVHGAYSYRASSALKLQEIALWLCIWGEAGSLRHTPEALCYIYHSCGAELHVHRDDDGKQRLGLSAPVRRQGQFLTDVVQPIFEVYRAEKGDMETAFRNYDDWNEFFWSRECLHYYFASPNYFVALSDDGESGAAQQSTRLLPDPSLPPSVSDGLKASSKTHLERRSWLHPARSFMRLISFYFTVFHILVCIAYCRFRGWPLLGPDANRAISSFVISLAGWSVVKELIEIWAQYGIIARSVENAAGFIARLGIKTVAFGYLFAFYQWSVDWSLDYYDAYFATACLYLLPYLCIVMAQIFPALALSSSPATSSLQVQYRRVVRAVAAFWYPTSRLYVGHDVNESKAQTYTYQLFWLLLLAIKFYCSYRFQVTPLIEPTFQILTAKPVWTHIWHYNEVADTLSIFILWIPFVLVYTFDTVIWYFMFQAVVGVLVGMQDRLGEIREFSALISAFTSLPWEFERKLLAWRAKEPHSIEPTPVHAHDTRQGYGIIGAESSEERAANVSVDMSGAAVDDDDSSAHPSSDESRILAEEYDLPVLVDAFRSTAWQNFAVAWNEVVEDLRHDDLLSNAEKQQLVFRMVPGSRKELYIPILLTAGCYENAVEKTGDIAHSYRDAQTDASRQQCTDRLMAYLNHPIRREGIMELWESTQWLLQTLLGDRHEKDLAVIHSAFEHIVRSGQLLAVVNGDNLTKLKPALLNFVRAMRIAAASFTTFLESEKKKREAREGDRTRERVRELAERDRELVSESDSEDEKDSPSSHPSSLHPLHTSKADKLSLKSILKSPSVGTLNILDTIRSHPRYQHSAVVVDDDEEENGRQYVILHLNLVRDQLQQFLNALSSLVKPTTAEAKAIGEKCKAILHDHHGFAWDDAYAGKCVHTVLKGSRISSILMTLHAHLTVAQIDAEPSNSEATRRLMFFANSLFMHIPSAPSIASMKSWSTLTPFHSEDVLYSFADLEKQTEDGVSVFFYLQTIYPNEWANFLQRVGIPDNRVASILHSRKTMEARMWATNRGQTLGRTIDGMMLYEKALRLLAKLEQPTLYDVDVDEMVVQKFQYVVSAQVYGKQKRESDPKAAEIDIYLRKYPNMRVAYIDTLKVPRHDAHGKQIVVEEHYSVLIKAEGGEVKEVYRVQLPGNPILGEGKPENQNQAIIFTRGEYLQTIDMNQSNGFEEALKMRNLLEEFNPRPGQKAVGIVGFREHIYTGGLSSIAQYMALQEGCFVSQGQRVLDRPLRVRFHYGHPDVFDKLFFMARGGVSKATKGINLSEDIFAGFNAILRGSSVVFREYLQVGKGRDVGLQQLYKFEAKLAQGNAMQTLSRDVYRLGQSLDFFRLLSFYFSGVGFYLSNSLTIWALYFFLYSRLLLAAFGVQKQDQFSGVETLSYWFGMAGFLLTIPVFTTLGLERGFLVSAYETARMLLTGGPLFFMFHMGTKAYYFEQTILAGGAKYRPTGRGFVTRHEDFSEIYRFHASSHFYRAMEMVFLLTFYAIVIPWGFSYGLVTWAGWLIVVSWLLAPIWFNPLAFQWEKMVEDVSNFTDWMNRKEGDGDRSWKAWWKDEIAYLSDLNLERRIVVSIIGCRHAVVGYALLHYIHAPKMQLLVGSTVILLGLAALAVAQAKFGHRHQYNVRALKALIFFSVLSGLYYYYSVYHFTLPSLYHSGIVLIGLLYFLSTLTTVLLTMGVRHRYLVRYYKLVDYCTASFLLSVIAVFSVTVVPSIIQTRLMFHNAFSRGVMIDKLLKLQEENQKDSTPNTDPAGSVPHKAGYQAEGADSTKPQFDFASIGFIERRSKSRLRLHGDEDEKTGVRRGGRKDESRHSNNGHTAEKEQTKRGREESSTSSKILGGSSGGLGGQSGRIPSYSSLSKLAEADEESTPKTTQHTQPPPLSTSNFGRGGGSMSVHTTTGTLSPLPLCSPSPVSGQPMQSPLTVNAPIPPTVATPPAGMAIPKTVSAVEYQQQQGNKSKRLSVKGMAAAIDDRSGKDGGVQGKKPPTA